MKSVSTLEIQYHEIGALAHMVAFSFAYFHITLTYNEICIQNTYKFKIRINKKKTLKHRFEYNMEPVNKITYTWHISLNKLLFKIYFYLQHFG